jgi:hypothetical protein
MRIDQETATAHLRLLQKYRPCPECGSDRVTVRQDASLLGSRAKPLASTTPKADGNVLRVECSDCSFAREFPEP